MENIVKVSDREVERLLTWSKTIQAVKQALISVTNVPKDGADSPKKEDLISVQTPRTFTNLPSSSGILLCMPSFIQGMDLGYGRKESSLSCKLITVFEENAKRDPPLPTSGGVVMLFDDETGQIKAMMDADQLTQRRTAAVSCVAGQVLGAGGRRVLAVIGAGSQGRTHAILFVKKFQFLEVRIWNRTTGRAQALVAELKGMAAHALLCSSPQECVQGADVIITATSAAQTLVMDDWVKADALILGIGVGKQSELSSEIYKRGLVYVESKASGSKELPHLKIEGELGELLLEKIPPPPKNKIRIFQSLGLGVEDAAVAQLVYNIKTKS